MRPAGRLLSLPVSRCVHAPSVASQSQTSARLRWVWKSLPPTKTVMPRLESYAMAWPQRALGTVPVVVRRVQPGVAGSHSHVSCWGMPFASAWSFFIPPNRTARLRWLSHTSAES